MNCIIKSIIAYIIIFFLAMYALDWVLEYQAKNLLMDGQV